MSRYRRLVARTLAWLAIGIVAIAALAMAALQTPYAKDRLRVLAVRLANDRLNGTLSIGRLDGSLLWDAELENVELEQDGVAAITIDRVRLDYKIGGLLGLDLVVDRVVLEGPRVQVVRSSSGWNLAHLLAPDDEPGEPAGRGVSIGAVAVENGSVAIDNRTDEDLSALPRRIFNLSGLLTLGSTPAGLHLQIDHLTMTTAKPDLEVERLEGGLTFGETFTFRDVSLETPESTLLVDGTLDTGSNPAAVDLAVRASPLSTSELARFVPRLPVDALAPVVDARVSGTMATLDITASIDEPDAGRVHLELGLDLDEPERAIAGRVTTDALDLHRIAADRFPKTVLTTAIDLDLRTARGFDLPSLEGPIRVEGHDLTYGPYTSRRALVDGALDGGTMAADIEIDAPVATLAATARIALPTDASPTWGYEVEGRVADADLRQLPPHLGLPVVATDLTADYHVTGSGTTADVTWRFARSRVPGAMFAGGGLGDVRVENGTVKRYAFDGVVTDLDLERVGRAFDIAVLADERLQSDLDVDLEAEATGTTLAELGLDATASLAGSEISGVRLSDFTITAHLEAGDLALRASGAFAAIDLERLTKRADLEGTATGSLDVTISLDDLTSPELIERFSADGTLALTDARVSELGLDDAWLDAAYDGDTLEIRRLEASGPTLDVSAEGNASLADTGDSDVTYSLRVSRLADIGAILDRPLSGSVALEGRITGNAAAYATDGTLDGSPLAYGDVFNALDFEATYEIALQDLETLTAEARLRSVLPRIGGREVRSLDAGLTYAGQTLTFETDVRENGRTLSGAGRVVFHPDHQELHVQRLGLTAGDVTWQIAGDQDVAVQYRPDRVVVERLNLASGPQTLSIAGVVSLDPGTTSDLEIDVVNVDLADLRALLLLNERQLAGRLDASARLAGTGSERTAHASVAVAGGGVEDFTFQSLSGRLEYRPEVSTVDLTLEQVPGATLTARGSVPSAVLGAGSDDDQAAGYDLQVNATAMDLAVIGAVTDQLTEIAGALEADLVIEGPAESPQIVGDVAIRNGAFRVAATGAPYESVEAVARLSPNRIDVPQLRVLDEEGDELTVTGGVGIEGTRLGAFETEVRATSFSVLDSDLGEVDIDATVRLEGEPSALRANGTVRIESGRLEIDEILDAIEPPAADVNGDAGETESGDDESEGPLSGTSIDLTIEVPDNLVVRGSDIRPPGGQFAVGDTNMTLGGDFSVRKVPGAELVLVGVVNTVRGSYDFQGRRFEILRDGTVAFRGDQPIDPALDLAAEREISGIVARVNIGGTVRTPTLSLSSNPPLDEGDVLALIVFNQPANQLGTGERASLAERAGALAAGLVVSPLTESIGQALDLDLFEITAPEAAGSGPSIVLGEQVGDDLFLRLRQQFGAQSVSEVMLEYRLADFLRLQGALAEGEGSANRGLTRRVERGGLDVIVFFEY